MNFRKTSPSRRSNYGFALRSVLYTLVSVGALVTYILWHTNFLASQTLLFALGGFDATHKSAWPTFSGDIVASDVTVFLPYDDEKAYLHFDELRIEMPFADWATGLVMIKTNPEKLLKSTNKFTLVLDGAKSPGDYSYGSSLSLLGIVSSVPFEALGCVHDAYWVRHEFSEMGLNPGPTQVRLSWQLESGQIIKKKTVATPGVGRVTATRVLARRGGGDVDAIRTSQQLELVSDRWELVDEGFMQARNRHCAKKDEVSVDIFVGRHMAAIDRFLAANGIAAGSNVAGLYKEFAENGGSLSISAEYQPAIAGRLYDGPITAWAPYIMGSITLNNDFAELDFTQVAVRPFVDDSLTVLEEMIEEGSLPLELQSDPAELPIDSPISSNSQ